jgi:thiamine biosynthesis lipoprotein
MVATARWDALGTWCEVLTLADDDLPTVAEVAREQVADLDLACSRLRPDSELSGLTHGSPQRISPVLCGAVAAALRTAEFSNGLVDPTVGAALGAQGYDADFDEVRARVAARLPQVAGVPGWRSVTLDGERALLTIPEGVELDLGASAKAWAADWIADTCSDVLGIACLVNLGGDIAVRGAVPPGGWQIEIEDGHRNPQGRPVISMSWPGGLATSSTVVRTWRTTEGEAHHIIDPATGRPSARNWRTVTVAARSCERANAASTAAIILGDSAPRWLTQRELPARLVHSGGVVVQTNGWPRQRWVA